MRIRQLCAFLIIIHGKVEPNICKIKCEKLYDDCLGLKSSLIAYLLNLTHIGLNWEYIIDQYAECNNEIEKCIFSAILSNINSLTHILWLFTCSWGIFHPQIFFHLIYWEHSAFRLIFQVVHDLHDKRNVTDHQFWLNHYNSIHFCLRMFCEL